MVATYPFDIKTTESFKKNNVTKGLEDLALLSPFEPNPTARPSNVPSTSSELELFQLFYKESCQPQGLSIEDAYEQDWRGNNAEINLA